MLGPFSFLDVALMAVALLSALLAMYRGLTREILSILSWLLAGGAALYVVFFQKPLAEDIAAQIGLPTQIAQVLIAGLLFLIVLVVVHLVTSRISDSILDSRVGMFDRMFGFVFGLLRGFVLVVIPFLFYEKLYPSPETHPVWVRNSLSLPMIRTTGAAFQSVLEQYAPSSIDIPTGSETQGFLKLPNGEPNGRMPHIVVTGLQPDGLHISVTNETAGGS